MFRICIPVAFATQLMAGAAFAQADTTTTFGGDWSQTLGTALFTENRADARPASEIESQWTNLSEEDRAMVRRDCMMHMQTSTGGASQTGAGSTMGTSAQSGVTTMGTTAPSGAGATTDTTAQSGTGTTTMGTTAQSGTGATTMGTTAQSGTGATTTGTTAQSGTGTTALGTTAQSGTGAATGTTAPAATGTTGMAGTTGMSGSATEVISVSAKQMDEICAATTDL